MTPRSTPTGAACRLPNIKKVWRSAVQRAGFTVGRADGFVFHNTRHSAVTNLSNAGVPAHDAMEISGHRTRSVFDRYNIGTEKQQRAALRAVSLNTEQVATKTTVMPPRRTATD